MNERKLYSHEFKQRAACMVIDDECSVPEVCVSLAMGQRRCVAGLIK